MVSAAIKRNQLEANRISTGIGQLFDLPLPLLCGWLLVAGCSFLNLANFQVDKDEVGLDSQVLIKLGMIGLGGLYGLHGFVSDRRIRSMLVSFPLVWIPIICGLYFLAVPFSSFPRNSLVSSCSIVAVLLMMVTALRQLGILSTIMAVFAGLSAFVVGSWAVYFVLPDIGVLVEPLPGGEFAYRMSGLAHANTLGQFSGLTVMLAIVLTITYRKGNPVVIAIGLLACGSLLNSFSRTSLVACLASVAFAYRHLYLKRQYMNLYLAGLVVGLLAIMVLSTQVDLQQKAVDKLSLLSKSADAEELTTATGRSAIWAHAIELIQKQPLTGYGAATQKYYFEDHSLYAHNMILNIAFSAGVFAGLAGLLMVFGRIRTLLNRQHPLVEATAVFIIVNGLFENVAFSILAGLPTMLWILVLCWPLLQDDQATQNDVESESNAASAQPAPRYLRLGAR